MVKITRRQHRNSVSMKLGTAFEKLLAKGLVIDRTKCPVGVTHAIVKKPMKPMKPVTP